MAVIRPTADRVIDWTPGLYTGVKGGYLQYRPGGASQRTNIIDVTQAPYFADNSGATDASVAINAAISAAGPGDVVYLPAGTYLIQNTIYFGTKSNITFRGAGYLATFLVLSGNVKMSIGVGTDYTYAYPSTGNDVTAGLTKGSTTVNIADTSAFSVGQMIRIRFEDTTDDALIAAGATPVIHVDGYGYNRAQMAKVVSKTSGSLTFEPPLYHTPAVAAAKVSVFQVQNNFIGLEEFSLDANLASSSVGIEVEQCLNLWFYRVIAKKSANYNVSLINSLYVEFRESNLSERHGSGTNGGALLMNNACGIFAAHTIFQKVFPCIEVNSSSSGNAFFKCVMERAGGQAGGHFNMNHGPHPSHNIVEQCVLNNEQPDSYFGSSSEGMSHRCWINSALLGGLDLSFGVKIGRFDWNYTYQACVIGWDGKVAGDFALVGLPNIGNNFSTGTTNIPAGTMWEDWKAVGTLTTRTSNTDGVLTLTKGHARVGQLIGLRWSGGGRNNVAVSSGSGSSVVYWDDTAYRVIGLSVGYGDNLPAQGSTIYMWAGASGFQEQVPTVEATLQLIGNYLCAAVGTGSVPPGQALGGGDTHADSLIFSSLPSGDLPSGYSDIAIGPENPAASQTYDAIPAGTWLRTGVNPFETPPTPTAPSFVVQPSTQTVTEGATVTFLSSATGYPTPTYQWKKNGSNISGATTSTLQIVGVVLGDAGSYTCVAANTEGTATSSAAVLTVNAASVSSTPQPRRRSASFGFGFTL